MNTINFISGGRMGDFIHSLYVVKNICEQRNAKANLFLNVNGDIWTFGIEKAFKDLYSIVSRQPYINQFNILPKETWYFTDGAIDLNDWRKEVATTHAETGKYNKCWSELLSEHYGFQIPNYCPTVDTLIESSCAKSKYAWLEVNEVDEFTKGAIVVHRSTHHHSSSAFWQNEFHKIKELAIFVTTDKREWDSFEFKQYTVPYIVSTVSDWVVAINSCDYFIGNQSAGFAIASALDVPRTAELYPDVAVFYKGEEKYSKNIKW